ncbi:MAG: hypothetical protein ACK4P2_06405 [Hyphomonas sp.]
MASALAAGIALSACQTADLSFGPVGGETKRLYGYSEIEQSPGTYVLKVVHPHAAVIEAHWDRRAGELCEGRPFTKTIFNAAHPTQLYDHYGGRPSGVLRLEGFLECAAEAGIPEGTGATEDDPSPELPEREPEPGKARDTSASFPEL